MKKVRICNNYILLCDFMFCNTYILLCDFFMFKVLGLKFFLLQNKDLFVFIIFGLGAQFEIDQAS